MLFRATLNYCRRFEDIHIDIFENIHHKFGAFLGDTRYLESFIIIVFFSLSNNFLRQDNYFSLPYHTDTSDTTKLFHLCKYNVLLLHELAQLIKYPITPHISTFTYI